MIKDKKEDLERYRNAHKHFDKAVDFLNSVDWNDQEDGIYTLDDEVYISLQSYTAKPRESVRFETHRTYIDLQYIVSGEEIVGYAPGETLNSLGPYDPEKDIEFYKPAPMTEIRLKQGEFIILYPGEGHLPCVEVPGKEGTAIKKAVVKIRYGA